MRTNHPYGALALAGTLGACATVPNTTVSYYPAKASVKVSTTETLACDAKKQNLIVATSTTATVTGMADRNATPLTLSFTAIKGTFADVDETFGFTDDGRLKSVNANSTGEGEAIVKSAMTIAATALAAGAAGGAPIVASADCQHIDDLGGGKPLSLTFSRTLWFRQTPMTGDVIAGPLAADDLAKVALTLIPNLPVPTLGVTGQKAVTPAASGVVTGDDIDLKLPRVSQITLTVTVGGADPWAQDVLVPTSGTSDLPVPKSKLFGKQGFTLALSDVGAITSIGYSKLSGASGALNAVNSIATPLEPTTAQDAANVKAQADLIAAQQRLVRCKANRATCT